MSPEKQRIAIAEACGWRKAEPPNTPVWWKNGEWVSNVYDLPDYPNDLNAMHEAEKVLTEAQRIDYFYDLNDAVGLVEPDSPAWISDLAVVSIAHATAAQRCEALLRTLNLWRDDL